ncbi:hypothetical protein T265_10754 [Opisthorchis viverrini]|uniref:Uncharacterized protein n=1 Tax=Opisthorchis viverrini TaxID=6198 RepID=A0A074Z5G6_OPIVI|nr:hypothetical protein T265_10754 [Opisthorchis viverrini]KER20767.1 hypothetical protein T265_10754 [Opisthorchis viverrini]
MIVRKRLRGARECTCPSPSTIKKNSSNHGTAIIYLAAITGVDLKVLKKPRDPIYAFLCCVVCYGGLKAVTVSRVLVTPEPKESSASSSVPQQNLQLSRGSLTAILYLMYRERASLAEGESDDSPIF